MEWEQRLADLWASLDELSEQAFLSKMELLVAELPADSAVAAFERAGSFDSTGHADLAVPLYRKALELGLEGQRRRRAVIQMASSLRNLGQATESVALLTAERERESDRVLRFGSAVPGISEGRALRWLVSLRGPALRLPTACWFRHDAACCPLFNREFPHRPWMFLARVAIRAGFHQLDRR